MDPFSSRRANSAPKELTVPPAIEVSEEADDALANAEVLTREEVLMRRRRQVRRLQKLYRRYYWGLMEDLRRLHREYYWKYGKSPFKEDDEAEGRENGVLVENVNVNNGQSYGDHLNGNGNASADGEGNSDKLGFVSGGGFNCCAVEGCTTKAMPLTQFCHMHILYDSRQTLYKPCKFHFDKWRDFQKINGVLCPPPCKANSRNDPGLIQCAKPILRTLTPSLCPAHVVKTERAIRQLLRKEGLSVGMSTKFGSKFHFLINEYVRLIQSRRRAAAVANKSKVTTIV